MQFIEIVPARIAVVQTDVKNVRLRFGHGKYQGPHTLQVCQSARWRHACLWICRECRINGIDIEVLITAHILHVQNVLGIPAPEIARNRPRSLRTYRARRAEWIGRFLQPDISRALIGLKKGKVLPVWRDLCASNLYFAKEELTVDDRWLLRTNRNRYGKADQHKS